MRVFAIHVPAQGGPEAGRADQPLGSGQKRTGRRRKLVRGRGADHEEEVRLHHLSIRIRTLQPGPQGTI